VVITKQNQLPLSASEIRPLALALLTWPTWTNKWLRLLESLAVCVVCVSLTQQLKGSRYATAVQLELILRLDSNQNIFYW